MRFLPSSFVKLVAINVLVLAVLIVPVELIFGTWIRPMGLQDLKRFSIPIGAQFEFDASSLYGGGSGPLLVRYSRDAWGLRGSHRTLGEIDVLTVGGSTTEQRYLDEGATWQDVAQSRLAELGKPLVLANAGVDGQSSVGHIFNFDSWFPLLAGLQPEVVLFYVGANDVMRLEQRASFDSSVDATSWRVRSATYQLLRTVRSNLRARSAGLFHGKGRSLTDEDFTSQGQLSAQQRDEVTNRIVESFLHNVETLRQRSQAFGARPVFMTQTAAGWNANPSSPSRGVKHTVTIFGVAVNYADVSFVHQALNRRLIAYCKANGVACFDLASEVAFGAADYYDFLHNTPAGAAKIGEYLAERLSGLNLTHKSTP